MDSKGSWSAASGVVAAVFGAGAITWVVTAPGSKLPSWPAIPFAVIGAVGFYGVFAALASWWPFRTFAADQSTRPRRVGEERADTDLLALLRAVLRESTAAPDEASTGRPSAAQELEDALRSPVVAVEFRTNLIPDEVSVYDAAAAVERGEPVAIRWPEVSNELYDRLSARRSVLKHELTGRGIDPGESLLSAYKQFDEMFGSGRFRREHAADRIPLMWAGMGGMAEYFGRPHLLEVFRQALQHFLVLANWYAVISMAAVQFPEDPPLPDGLHPFGKRYETFQNPSVAEAFGAAPPFWAADVSLAEESLYVFAPRQLVKDAYRNHQGSARASLLVDFAIPQLEETLIGDSVPKLYRHPADLAIFKLRDEQFSEVDSGALFFED